MHGAGIGSSSPEVPNLVGRYEVLLPLEGAGDANAAVYLARARGSMIDRDLVVKVLRGPFPRDLVEVGQAVARGRHPNLVPVLDFGEDAAGAYIVVDYVEGESLDRFRAVARERRASLPSAVRARIWLDAVAGLHAVHLLADGRGQPLGLTHGGFGPEAVLVGADGIARLSDTGFTHRVLGTRASRAGRGSYTSPEEVAGRATDRLADVWAAGVLLRASIA
jgi:serine/threonine-protein kinase